MPENDVIRILNFLPNLRQAGIESFVMSVYRNIDRSKIQFDFVVHSTKREFYDDEVEALGGKIYYLTYKDDKNLFKYVKDLNRLFQEHPEYRIVHGHMQSMMPLYLNYAKKNHVPVRIAHSHNNSYEKSLKGTVLHLFSRFSRYPATDCYACSDDSGRYLFGNRKFDVIYNGIDMQKFTYNDSVREQLRKKLQIGTDEILLGTVGRMEKQKNQMFLLNVLSGVVKRSSKYKLILIGSGSLEGELCRFVEQNKLQEHVIFLGNVSNVNEYMCAMDLFVLPSLYEGLGIVLIEAQAAGLHCLTTRDTVAAETKVTSRIQYLSLEQSEWEKAILGFRPDIRSQKKERSIELFDIRNVAGDMEERYRSFYKKITEMNTYV